MMTEKIQSPGETNEEMLHPLFDNVGRDLARCRASQILSPEQKCINHSLDPQHYTSGAPFVALSI